MNDEQLWQTITSQDFSPYKRHINYLLNKYGTSNRCNRFDVGNVIEFIIRDWMISGNNLNVDSLPNEKRIDLCINNTYKLSVKYSSGGNIKLHNSNNTINSDMSMSNTLLITPERLYLLTKENIKDCGLNVEDYLKNTGDGLQLKGKIRTILDKKKFKYRLDVEISTQSLNMSCAEVIYRQTKEDTETIYKYYHRLKIAH